METQEELSLLSSNACYAVPNVNELAILDGIKETQMLK